MSFSVPAPPPVPPEPKRHLIYSYFIESTGIHEAFKKLFESYLTSDEFLKLNQTEDQLLITILEESITSIFALPGSTICPNLEQLRLNAYWRLFGYEIPTKGQFSKPALCNAGFNKTLEDAMYEIFQGILDQQHQEVKLANPAALAQILNTLRTDIVNRRYNEIELITVHAAILLTNLLTLLDNNDLMAKRLGIRSTGRDSRLIELGEKLKVPVAKQTKYLIILAERMEYFLNEVEGNPDWTPEAAAALFEMGGFFKEISSAWYQVTGKDFMVEALKARRSSGQREKSS